MANFQLIDFLPFYGQWQIFDLLIFFQFIANGKFSSFLPLAMAKAKVTTLVVKNY